jgi:signal transduction histidine kinase
MKYGAGKPIEVSVSTEDGRAVLVVRDHGIGIAREDQSKLGIRFERAASVRHYGGLGLGLYIAREIVLAHAGTMRVESELGRGAAFIVELPASSTATAAYPRAG